MHSVTQLTGGVQWDGDRNKDIPVGAVGAQHHSGVSGTCEDRAGCQHFALGNTLPSQDNVGRGASQPTAHVYRMPAISAWLVAFGGQSLDQDGSCLTQGNLLNQLEVLPAGGGHIAHTCGGSSATGLPCNDAHTAPAVRLLFPVFAQLCDSLGRAPQSFADCLDHVPLGREYPGQMPEVALRLAFPNITTRHHEAPRGTTRHPSARCKRAVPS